MPNSEIVDEFNRIKDEAGCDDMTAAVLALANAVRFVSVNIQFDDNGYPEIIGGDIADAIKGAVESVSQGGAININTGAFKAVKPRSATPPKKRKKK